ncbi:hypothetical protein [Leptospirillum ferriphilum]|uniref:Uncharacterized protein n=1 Tax=Leptospirillum ferriphilum YSK TaxID=1441628 RepID=A0A059XXB6_9BACT|nr:hypothetical protein [Leptospirillum ferriphilum]AIA31558.1 hypothetical protein Y981_03510 [Leptospirillum ferriphilum YSK]
MRGKEVIKTGKIVKSDEVRRLLISLIEKKKCSFQSGISEIVRREFDLVSQARESGASWTEIVDTLGFPGKEAAMALAYWRERRRQKKGEGNSPATVESRKSPVLPVETPKKENRESVFSAVPTREAGITTPLGRGKFQINRETSEEKL